MPAIFLMLFLCYLHSYNIFVIKWPCRIHYITNKSVVKSAMPCVIYRSLQSLPTDQLNFSHYGCRICITL